MSIKEIFAHEPEQTSVCKRRQKMLDFNQQIARLKEALAVTKDQDVADALGLSKAAFSDRKKRGAFPDDKLLALIAKRPDLGLDYGYITSGFHSAVYCGHCISSKHSILELLMLPFVKGGDRYVKIILAAKRSWEGRVGENETLPVARTLTEGFTEDELKHTVAILLDELNRYGRRP